jgi:hypothetical protein
MASMASMGLHHEGLDIRHRLVRIRPDAITGRRINPFCA